MRQFAQLTAWMLCSFWIVIPVRASVLCQHSQSAACLVTDSAYFSEIASKIERESAFNHVAAQKQQTKKTDSPIWAGIKSSFAIPYEEWFEKKHDSEWRNLLSGLSVSASLSVPLKDTAVQDTDGGVGQGDRGSRSLKAVLGLKYKIVGYWFASIAFFEYFDEDLQAPWDPDFVYTFGYNDWHPYTFSLVYSNYGGNRLNPDRSRGEKVTRFNQGAWTLGWKFPAPDFLQSLVAITEKSRLGCNISASVIPEYFDLKSLENRKWKKKLGLGCKYTISGPWYINATAFYYPDSEQQQPWDPDFTYGFGYFDWRPGTITIQYNNYSGNRFPGRERGRNTGRFIDGGLSISWSYSF